jgi:hypothetical protein
MQVSSEIQMPSADVKQVWILLAMCCVFLLMFVPMLIMFIGVIPRLRQTPSNLFFIASTASLLVLLVLVSAWYGVLFAIHVRAARWRDGHIEVERVFAPRVRLGPARAGRRRAIAVPAFDSPGYKRGTLYFMGLASLYVPGHWSNASILNDWLSAETRAS